MGEQAEQAVDGPLMAATGKGDVGGVRWRAEDKGIVKGKLELKRVNAWCCSPPTGATTI